MKFVSCKSSYTRIVPTSALKALCFDMIIINVASGQIIGTAEDCLAEDADGVNRGVLLTGTTFFNFPEGQLVSRGRTTVHPLNKMAPGAIPTHITGAIPAPGSNQVLRGTGRFDGAAGTSGSPEPSTRADSAVKERLSPSVACSRLTFRQVNPGPRKQGQNLGAEEAEVPTTADL